MLSVTVIAEKAIVIEESANVIICFVIAPTCTFSGTIKVIFFVLK